MVNERLRKYAMRILVGSDFVVGSQRMVSFQLPMARCRENATGGEGDGIGGWASLDENDVRC